MTLYSDSDSLFPTKYRGEDQAKGVIKNNNLSLAKAGAFAGGFSADSISLLSEAIRSSAQKISQNAVNLSQRRESLNHILHEIDVGSPLVKIQSLIALLDTEVENLSKEAHFAEVSSAPSPQAGAASRFLSVLITKMNQEIRTLLEVIKGFADLLQETPSSSKASSWIDSILHASEQLESLITGGFDLWKIQAGRMDVKVSDCDVENLIRECREFFETKIQKKGLKLEFRRDAKVPVVIATDRSRLKEILIHIIGNAVKFSDHGTIRVSLHMLASDLGHKKLVVDVADQGMGVGPEREPNLFKLCTQADTTSGLTFGGSGLGLCLCKQVAHLLNGDISYAPNLPHGSVFSVAIDAEFEGARYRCPPSRTLADQVKH